jgi:hypothetical protein
VAELGLRAGSLSSRNEAVRRPNTTTPQLEWRPRTCEFCALQHVVVRHLRSSTRSRDATKTVGVMIPPRITSAAMTATGRSISAPKWTWLRRVVVALVLASSLLAPLTSGDASASAVAAPSTSYYEKGASTAALYLQGEAAGKAGTQGIVILDFGRPAFDGTSEGTFDFGRTFLSFAAISAGVENYIMGYYNYAPADTTLDVAVGTNNSCGLHQPCGAVVCGCPYEPGNYMTWGQGLAYTVEHLRAWSAEVASSNGFTDTVRVVAGDDAEPAFDPGFNNTYYVMRGYAQVVGGSSPPMVDYGSADPGIWSNDQLLQVANGFSPNVAMPEIYNSSQVGEWAALVAYAKARYGEVVTLFGVLTEAASTDPPQNPVAQTVGAVVPITGQDNIPWVSAITH